MSESCDEARRLIRTAAVQPFIREAMVSLVNQIEKLEAERDSYKADADKWQTYQARKVSLRNAGFGRNPLREDKGAAHG